VTETAERMRNRLPPATYRRSIFLGRLLSVEADEIDLLLASVVGGDGATAQFFTDTATWTLDKWEDQLGLPNGASLTTQDRHNRLHARWLTFGTTTPERIHSIANSFDNGLVDVVEDFEHYTIKIIFVELFGIPETEEAMLDALRVALPAHLSIETLHRYVTWDVFDDRNHTWDEFDALNYLWDDLPSSQV
jgi:hypothetical protein